MTQNPLLDQHSNYIFDNCKHFCKIQITHSIYDSVSPLPWFCKRPNTPLYYFVMPENQQAKDFFWQAGCLKSRSLMSAKCANIKKNTIWRHFTSFLVLSHCAKI